MAAWTAALCLILPVASDVIKLALAWCSKGGGRQRLSCGSLNGICRSAAGLDQHGNARFDGGDGNGVGFA